jgi:hypothetical protein
LFFRGIVRVANPLIPSAKPHRGRPSKFGRVSRPVTVTLPDDVVAALRALDPDLSRAIVHASEVASARAAGPSVALTRYGTSAVIVVTPNRVVERLPGVKLVPLPNGRALISLDRETNVAEFEVRLRDALVDAGTTATERESLETIGAILRRARHSRGVHLNQRNIIVLETPPLERHVRTRARRLTRPKEK